MYILNENNQKQTVLKRGKTWAVSGQSEKINNKPQKNLPWLHLRNKYENMYRLAFSSISEYFYFA